jgi:hypothetical protein
MQVYNTFQYCGCYMIHARMYGISSIVALLKLTTLGRAAWTASASVLESAAKKASDSASHLCAKASYVHLTSFPRFPIG